MHPENGFKLKKFLPRAVQDLMDGGVGESEAIRQWKESQRTELLREGAANPDVQMLVTNLLAHPRLAELKIFEMFMERTLQGYDLLGDFNKYRQYLLAEGVTSDDIFGDYIDDILRDKDV